jgi:Zn-dependent protease with chaperone function
MGRLPLGLCVALFIAIGALPAPGQPLPIAQASPIQPAQTPTHPAAQASQAGQTSTPQQAYTLPPDKLAKAIALSRIRNILDFASSIWGIVFLWLLLAARFAAAIEHWTQRIAAQRWLQGCLFFAVFLALTTLAGLPLDMIGHHYSRGFGISVQSWSGWFGDQSKALGLTLVIGTPILLLFNWIVRRWPRRYWLGLWVVTVPILVASVFIEPLIEPLFEKYEPLQQNHAALVAELEKVVARTGTNIPPDRMYLMKASAKTNGLNAYVTGIGATKRIVVWDTTAGRIPDDEVMFVFGHESGHYVLHHLPKGIALSAAALFFIYWGCAAFSAWLVRRFGAPWGASDAASRTGFVVLLFAITIVSFLLQPVDNAIHRHFEHQADVYGLEAIHGLVPDPQQTAVAAFNALGAAWLDDPNPSPLIEFWLYDHPSTQDRCNFALHYNPWANGGRGKFFAN